MRYMHLEGFSAGRRFAHDALQPYVESILNIGCRRYGSFLSIFARRMERVVLEVKPTGEPSTPHGGWRQMGADPEGKCVPARMRRHVMADFRDDDESEAESAKRFVDSVVATSDTFAALVRHML